MRSATRKERIEIYRKMKKRELAEKCVNLEDARETLKDQHSGQCSRLIKAKDEMKAEADRRNNALMFDCRRLRKERNSATESADYWQKRAMEMRGMDGSDV